MADDAVQQNLNDSFQKTQTLNPKPLNLETGTWRESDTVRQNLNDELARRAYPAAIARQKSVGEEKSTQN
jgi:hypothetical protein